LELNIAAGTVDVGLAMVVGMTVDTLEMLSDVEGEGPSETDVEISLGIVEDLVRDDGLIVMRVVGFAAGAPED
jgi:hypothetical protein